MALRNAADYVFAPKATYVGPSGVVNACMVGTKRVVFCMPVDAIGGAGSTVTTTRFTLDGKDPVAGMQSALLDPELDLDGLEAWLRDLSGQVSDTQLVELDQVSALKVKAGLLSRGMYWKVPGKMGWKGLAISGKDVAKQFMTFYADRVSG